MAASIYSSGCPPPCNYLFGSWYHNLLVPSDPQVIVASHCYHHSEQNYSRSPSLNIDHIIGMSPLLNLSSNLPTRICHLFAIRTLADIPTLRGTRKRDPQNKLLELGCSNIYQQSYSLFSVGKWNSGVGGYLVLQRHVITKSSPARKGVKCKCEQSTHRAKKTESTGSWL